MTWLYALTKALYFPGAFLRACWEHLICRALHVPIVSADSYLSWSRNSGHVDMLPAPTAAASFGVCTLPGLLNLVVGCPAFAAGALTLGYLGVDVIDPMSGKLCPSFIVYVLIYLFGASCLCSLFPRVQDARHLRQTLYGRGNSTSGGVKASAFLPTCVVCVGAALEYCCVPFFVSMALLVWWIVT